MHESVHKHIVNCIRPEDNLKHQKPRKLKHRKLAHSAKFFTHLEKILALPLSPLVPRWTEKRERCENLHPDNPLLFWNSRKFVFVLLKHKAGLLSSTEVLRHPMVPTLSLFVTYFLNFKLVIWNFFGQYSRDNFTRCLLK